MAARRGAAIFVPISSAVARPRTLSQWSKPLCKGFLSMKSVTRPPATVYQSVRYSSDIANATGAAKTPLFDLHESYGAKFVTFGGYSMPVQYNDLSVGVSHNWTREKASLFDVSHMVQHYIFGPGAAAFLERVTPSSVSALKDHHSTLSCLLHPNSGGIVDDTIITKLTSEKFYVVTNAACRQKDSQYLGQELRSWREQKQPDVQWERLDGRGLIALQGPLAADILSAALPKESRDLRDLFFGQSKYVTFHLPTGQVVEDVLVSRGGYTGEDGFEISIPGPQTAGITEMLLESAGPERLRLAGLGARDSLRLEAGMCLYGHDLDDTTTPVEGALSWVIGKDRREKGGFHGSEVILAQLKPKKDGGSGVSRRRVGLLIEGAPAREGAEIVDENGDPVGKITSGCPSPTLKKNIAMGYIKNGLHKSGTEVQVVVRGKKRKAVITKMPFVPSKYWKGGATPA